MPNSVRVTSKKLKALVIYDSRINKECSRLYYGNNLSKSADKQTNKQTKLGRWSADNLGVGKQGGH